MDIDCQVGVRCHRHNPSKKLEYDWVLEFDIRGLFDNIDMNC